jgi:DNA polymerase III sliding clamp (beta) subunit (PCNA family)
MSRRRLSLRVYIAIAVKLIDAQFPPYGQVIPKGHKKVITVDRLRFVDGSGAPS